MAILIPSGNIYQPKNNKIIDNKIGAVTIDEKLNYFGNGNIYSTRFDFWTPNQAGEDIQVSENGQTVFSPYKVDDLRAYNNTINQNEIKPKIINAIYEDDIETDTKRIFSFFTKKIKIDKPIKSNSLGFTVNLNYFPTSSELEKKLYSIEAIIDIFDYSIRYYGELFVNDDFIKFGYFDNEEAFKTEYLKYTDRYIVKNSLPRNTNIVLGCSLLGDYIEFYLLCKTDYSRRLINNGNQIFTVDEIITNLVLNLTANILSQEEEKKEYKSSNPQNKPFKLLNNELAQVDNIYNENSLSSYVANNILVEYLNGKETLTLNCTIDDYYEFDESKADFKGEKVIKPNDSNASKMAFENYDIVIPTILDIDGKNKPISYYSDMVSSPKEFIVLKNAFDYNGIIFQKLECQEKPLTDLVYEINFTLGEYGDKEKIGAKFKVKGFGSIYVNDNFYKTIEFATATDIIIPYEDINTETANFKFLGFWYQISTTSYQLSSIANSQGKLNSVVQWDKRYAKTFESQFVMQTFNADFEIPSNITTISASTFSEVKSQYLITVPQSVKVIEKNAFAYGGLTKIKFLHNIYDTINFPTAGSVTGAFYSKNAYNLTIYTDNLMVKNYDWTTDNVTPTFYHLDGTLWE